MVFTKPVRNWLIYATNFFLAAALGVVFVFFEDVQTAYGLADWEIGVIAASGFAAALVVQILVSPLADRGNTKPLAIIGMTSAIAGPIGFAYGESLLTLATSRGLTGIGLGLFGMLARKALLGFDTVGGGAKLGVLLSTAVAGFISGPLLGAVLEPWGFEAPFLVVSGGLIVVGIPASIAVVRSDMAVTEVDYGDLRQLIKRPRIQAAMLVGVLVFGFIGVFDALVDRFLTDLGADNGAVAIVLLAVGLPMLILPRIAGKLAQSRGAAFVMLPAALALAPVMIGYGLVGSVLLVGIVGFAHGTAESFASVSAQVLVLEVTGTERIAVGSALLETAGLSAAAVAAAISPSLYGRYGQDYFLAVAAVGVLLSLVALHRVRNAWD